MVTMSCNPLEDFWLSSDQSGLTPFNLFAATFLLFGLWAFVEIVASHIGNYGDKWFCTLICSLVILLVLGIMAGLRAQWEYFEVQRGVRSFKNLTFQLAEMPDKIYINPWREFLEEKRCADPEFYENLDSEEEWLQLEEEFKKGGGTFESIEVSS